MTKSSSTLGSKEKGLDGKKAAATPVKAVDVLVDDDKVTPTITAPVTADVDVATGEDESVKRAVGKNEEAEKREEEEIMLANRVKDKDMGALGGDIVDVDVGHVSSGAAIAAQMKNRAAKPETRKTKEVLEAERVSDAQVRKYWRAREAERIAPRGEFALIFLSSAFA